MMRTNRPSICQGFAGGEVLKASNAAPPSGQSRPSRSTASPENLLRFSRSCLSSAPRR